MRNLVIKDVERTWVSIPLKPRHAKNLIRGHFGWTIFEILRVRTNSDLTGYGETMIHYTWGKVPQEQIDRVIGHSPFEFLWDDALGAGLQMAIWDLAGKAAGVPCYRLFGPQVREWCEVAWWVNDMSTEDWVEEIKEALSLGYMSAKLKARPWRDFAAAMHTLKDIVPSDFRFDADFNAFLVDAGHAVPYLTDLANDVPSIAIFETPIPQGDVEGNVLIRNKVSRPIAMHYGSPAIQTVIRDGVCDGFVISGGVSGIKEQAVLAAQVNKPFWLQMVGTGLTVSLMLHLAATLTHARWPAITCHEIYVDDLLQERLEVRNGLAHVPEAPGLGIELDEVAISRYQVEVGFKASPPRNLYYVIWPNGDTIVFPPGLAGTPSDGEGGLRKEFSEGKWPIFHRGVRLEIVPDDGSGEWQRLYDRARQAAPVRL